jgi:hypothetical protein
MSEVCSCIYLLAAKSVTGKKVPHRRISRIFARKASSTYLGIIMQIAGMYYSYESQMLYHYYIARNW